MHGVSPIVSSTLSNSRPRPAVVLTLPLMVMALSERPRLSHSGLIVQHGSVGRLAIAPDRHWRHVAPFAADEGRVEPRRAAARIDRRLEAVGVLDDGAALRHQPEGAAV